MRFSDLKEYLDAELEDVENKIISAKHMFEKNEHQINQIVSRVQFIEDDFDFAYEAFSPISKKSEYTKLEIDSLNQELLKLRENQSVLEANLKEYQEKKEQLQFFLKDFRQNQRSGDERVKIMKENFDRLFGVKILEQQELERQRIARDLHDTTVQNLTAMIHKIEFCQQIMDMDSIRAKLELQLLSNTLRESIDDMREIIYNLRPMTYDDMGFGDTLFRAVERLKKGTDIKINFDIQGVPYEMDSVIQLTILRIIQEATNNSKKYSKAEILNIIISYEENQIVICIEDNGIGFNIDQIKNQKRTDNSGFGISMMKERVYLLNGKIEINSQLDKGTEIIVVLPKEGLEEY